MWGGNIWTGKSQAYIFCQAVEQIKNLQLSSYNPFLFHLPSGNFLSSVFPTQTCCCCPLLSCLFSPAFLLRERERDKEQVLREAAPAGVQRTELALFAALCQVQQLQAPCQWPVLSKNCVREIRAMCLSGDVSLAIPTIYLGVNWSQMELCSSEVTFCMK